MYFRIMCYVLALGFVFFYPYISCALVLIALFNQFVISSPKLIKNEEININDQDILIGNDSNGGVFLSDNELNQHALVIGTTGAGKTTTLLNFVESCAIRNLPCIYLDGKGSFDLIDKLSNIANKHNRVFKVFCLRPNTNINHLAGYNPFGSGNATEWKNRIMSLFSQVGNKGQEHFSLGEQNYINFVAQVLYRLNKTVDLRVLLAFLENPEKLLSVAHDIDSSLAQKIAKLHNDKNINTLLGDVLKLLELFIYSDYGWLFNTTKLDNVINIRDSILNNEIVLFLFDASSYPEDTNKVAKMVINDINSSFAGFNDFTKCYCIFDEFASYASPNLAETISLQRSRGMHAIIGTQSIATVKLKSSESRRVAEELLACCNTYIIQKINHDDDSQIMARIIGYQDQIKTNHAINLTNNSQSINYTVNNNFIVMPQVFKDLITGEAVIQRKVGQTLHLNVRVNVIK